MVPAVRYQDLYRSCIQEAYALLSQSREISRLLGPIRRATTLYPYDESLHILYISACFSFSATKRRWRSMTGWSTCCLMTWALAPPRSSRSCSNESPGKIQPLASSLDAIREDMSEGETQTGAYQCNFHDFTSTYRFVVRHIERSGQSAFLMLCSVTQWDGSVPGQGVRICGRYPGRFRMRCGIPCGGGISAPGIVLLNSCCY